MSKPFPKSSDPTLTSSTSTLESSQLSVTLSPLRKTSDSPAPVTLTASARTSVYDLKTQISAQTGYEPDKLKLLWERRPVTDSKTLKDITGKLDGDVDLAVMYTGAPTATPQMTASVPKPTASEPSNSNRMDVDETPVAQGPSGEAILNTTQFWDDLQDFVIQRVRDESVGKRTVEQWKQSRKLQ